MDEACAVCLESRGEAVTLPCKHVFCRSCVLRLKQYAIYRCPLCRAELPMDPEERRAEHAKRAVSEGVRELIRATSGERVDEELLSRSIEKLEEAVKLDDSNLAAKVALSNAWAQRNPDRALSLAEECVKRSKCAASLATLGLALEKSNRINDAIEQYERAVRRDSNHFYAHASLGMLLFKVKRFEDSIKMFDRTIEISPPNDPTFYFNKALALEAANRREEALLAYKTAIATDSNHYPSHMNLGHLLLNISPRDAARYFEKASKYASTPEKRLDALYSLGDALFRNNDTKKHAVTVFGLLKALMMTSKYSSNNLTLDTVLICLGKSLKSVGRISEAIKMYISAIRHNESNVDGWISLGMFCVCVCVCVCVCFSQQQQYSLQCDHYTGTAYGSTKQFESALHCFCVATKISSDIDLAFLNQAFALLDLNRVEDAKLSLQKCINLKGDCVEDAKRLLDKIS